MEAILLELQQLDEKSEALFLALMQRFDEWNAVQKRRQELINQLEAKR